MDGDDVIDCTPLLALFGSLLNSSQNVSMYVHVFYVSVLLCLSTCIHVYFVRLNLNIRVQIYIFMCVFLLRACTHYIRSLLEL